MHNADAPQGPSGFSVSRAEVSNLDSLGVLAVECFSRNRANIAGGPINGGKVRTVPIGRGPRRACIQTGFLKEIFRVKSRLQILPAPLTWANLGSGKNGSRLSEGLTLRDGSSQIQYVLRNLLAPERTHYKEIPLLRNATA